MARVEYPIALVFEVGFYMMEKTVVRCHWVGEDRLYQDYHDKEWGKPEYDARKLFEQLCLEGQQAGLAWITVLKKREHYRRAFFNFDPEKIAAMNDADIERCMQNTGLIRHRAKLNAIVKNARALLIMNAYGENFADFIWSFAQEKSSCDETAAKRMSKALKKRGFVFVGETTCYAFMQAVGLVDDHETGCFLHSP